VFWQKYKSAGTPTLRVSPNLPKISVRTRFICEGGEKERESERARERENAGEKAERGAWVEKWWAR
tara:strand:- start:104 stop:301 length:198 start_codon:yes stop_codon:yes gene_type:complete